MFLKDHCLDLDVSQTTAATRTKGRRPLPGTVYRWPAFLYVHRTVGWTCTSTSQLCVAFSDWLRSFFKTLKGQQRNSLNFYKGE